MGEKETKKLLEYMDQYKRLSSVKVYESDREVAEVIKNVPIDRESLARYRRYGIIVKKV